MLDKMTRIQNMVTKLSSAMQIDEDMLQVLQVAASLAMSDLATAVVTEFTSLAGIMARHYAIRDGYPEQVHLTFNCYFFFSGFIYVFFLFVRNLCIIPSHVLLNIIYSVFVSVSVLCVLQVAEALYEITLPRFSGDILPATDAGIVLAIADR